MTFNSIDINIIWDGFINFLRTDWWVVLLVLMFLVYVYKTK